MKDAGFSNAAKPERDKRTRMSIQSAKFESEQFFSRSKQHGFPINWRTSFLLPDVVA
jgi:hypothetical protein